MPIFPAYLPGWPMTSSNGTNECHFWDNYPAEMCQIRPRKKSCLDKIFSHWRVGTFWCLVIYCFCFLVFPLSGCHTIPSPKFWNWKVCDDFEDAISCHNELFSCPTFFTGAKAGQTTFLCNKYQNKRRWKRNNKATHCHLSLSRKRQEAWMHISMRAGWDLVRWAPLFSHASFFPTHLRTWMFTVEAEIRLLGVKDD